jgi:hypothetical protein
MTTTTETTYNNLDKSRSLIEVANSLADKADAMGLDVAVSVTVERFPEILLTLDDGDGTCEGCDTFEEGVEILQAWARQ